jgi:hypothetical protein
MVEKYVFKDLLTGNSAFFPNFAMNFAPLSNT